MIISYSDAIRNARSNNGYRIANKASATFRLGCIFPHIAPRFRLDSGQTVFTIGSCFARNIEMHLRGFVLPTLSFEVPPTEWPFKRGILNEYNPGSMRQRILWGLSGQGPRDEVARAPAGDGFADLLLPGHTQSLPVTAERFTERRGQIGDLYNKLQTADAAIITLGLVEAWLDEETGLFLNQMPPRGLAQSGRYSLRVLDSDEAFRILDEAVGALVESGVRRVLLTVSPVPLHVTFTNCDAAIANSYSKATLRVCAERLYRRFPEVDYFPSYEIVTSAGVSALLDDNVHVRDEVVAQVVAFMVESYVG